MLKLRKSTILLLIFAAITQLKNGINAQETLPLCGQHIVQNQLPYSEERIQRMQALDLEQKAIQQQKKNQAPKRQIYKIPVVFHVIHYHGSENISYEQIVDAMSVLNRDYRLQNTDAALVHPDFNANNSLAVATPADIEVEFVLAKKAPDGTCFNGVTRTISSKTSTTGDGFVQLDEIINKNDVYRGIWPAKNYMNVIVVKNSNNTGGYTFMPGSFNPENMYASIWINSGYVGRFGTSDENKSRVLTHEVGHWLNLHHTWGGNNNPAIACGDDEVDDTPETRGVTTCNLNENFCGNRANVENYMDYSYCSKMFTHGQKDRMRACLQTSVRKTLWTSQNLVLTGIDGNQSLCYVDFNIPKKEFCVGENIQFTDYSGEGQTSWNWEFEGANTTTSTLQNPLISYPTPGTYAVKLTVSDGTNSISKTKNAFIKILPNSIQIPYFEGFENHTSISAIENITVRNYTTSAPTWEIVNVGATGTKSMGLYNYYMNDKTINEFLSPVFDLSNIPNAQKVTLSFKYAYRKKESSTSENLSIQVSKDCGNTWVHRKALQGTGLSPLVEANSFIPSATDFITTHVVNITNTYFTSNFQFKILFDGNAGNNLFIDDINLYQGEPSDDIILSTNEIASQSNWTVSPNPSNNLFYIDFEQATPENVALDLWDAAGKKVYATTIHAAAGKNKIVLDVQQYTPGVYILQLGTQQQKVIIQ